MVAEYGTGYFKFDCNIEVLQGADFDELEKSPVISALEHNGTYHEWVYRLYTAGIPIYIVVIGSCARGVRR